MKKNLLIGSVVLTLSCFASAQTFTQYTTTEQQPWQTKGKVSLATKAKAQPAVCPTVSPSGKTTFLAWGTCFNELDLDAIRLLKPEEQEMIMHDIFAPDGDLRFTRGRQRAQRLEEDWK